MEKSVWDAMGIVQVNAALADLTSANVDASEEVAAALVEWLLSETNTFYCQHVLNQTSFHSTAQALTASILDTITAVTLVPGEDDLKWRAEGHPCAPSRDRHAARSVVVKGRSQDPPTTGSSGNNVTGGAIVFPRSPKSPIVLAESTDCKKRKNVDTKRLSPAVTVPSTSAAVPSSPILAVPKLVTPRISPIRCFTLPDEPEEDMELKSWRTECLNEIARKNKPPINKWITTTRAVAALTPKMSYHLEVIQHAPELFAHTSNSKCPTKTAIETFQQIQHLVPANALIQDEEETSRSSTPTTFSMANTGSTTPKGARKFSVTGGAGGVGYGHRGKNVLLQDGLSRRRPRKFSFTHFKEDPCFVRDQCEDMDATAISSSINLCSGVSFVQGCVTKHGPERTESLQCMSKKRFEIHQQVGGEIAWHDQGPPKRISASTSVPTLPDHLFVQAPPQRPIENGPSTEKTSIESTDGLAIPRTHLSASLSTPSLRVRAPPSAVRGTKLTKLDSLDEVDVWKHRPNTADPQGLHQVSKSGSAPKVHTSSTYLREFPQPKPGVVRVSKRFDEQQQRLAWIS